MLSTIPVNRRVIMQTNAPKSQKTSGGLDNLHVND